jgi:hypothetical protein
VKSDALVAASKSSLPLLSDHAWYQLLPSAVDDPHR